jgi:hypothetical protein
MPPSGGVASSVVGVANRFSSSCCKHTFSRAPSLHGNYPASSLLWAPPTPEWAATALCLPPVALRSSPSPSRASQVPRQTCPHAPSPITPESPMYTHARYSYTGNRLHHSMAGWPPSLSVTRPKRVRLRYGSCVRRSGLRPWDYSQKPPDCLHGERASPMTTTFQVVRSVRLILTHHRTHRNSEKIGRNRCNLWIDSCSFFVDFAVFAVKWLGIDSPLLGAQALKEECCVLRDKSDRAILT